MVISWRWHFPWPEVHLKRDSVGFSKWFSGDGLLDVAVNEVRKD
ncbi:predicted protein [Sclerotinia sclerotiorum 1980 UF-70]|uniref:Uncharacterized protein n=1 Tax=Sclerotinia sclerotiorum (strain ATCC 18683 / 1980 / Ss-1) TaxID=665079 RepID=A7FA07_SCLS1|nr:predicted protein [Sclerotinia sclerotiorum 1980 UF-70]EDO00568.1 predicted protein [Sclerotinia sclerotiorum 1980 UF-70]